MLQVFLFFFVTMIVSAISMILSGGNKFNRFFYWASALFAMGILCFGE